MTIYHLKQITLKSQNCLSIFKYFLRLIKITIGLKPKKTEGYENSYFRKAHNNRSCRNDWF